MVSKYDTTVCEICYLGDREDCLLLCDVCDRGYHNSCLKIKGIPEGEWLCPNCSVGGLPWYRNNSVLWDEDPVSKISQEEVMEVLHRFTPRKLSQQNVCVQLRTLLEFLEHMTINGIPNRAIVTDIIFRIVEENRWFLTAWPSFYKVVKDKLLEFAEDDSCPEAKEIYQKYCYMLDINN